MADRVSVAIRIGGSLPLGYAGELLAAIESDGAHADWEGSPILRDDLALDQSLYLVANEVAWGRFDAIEDFCCEHGLPFARWSAALPGSEGERIVFDGETVREFVASDDDEVMVRAHKLRDLGTYEAVLAYLAAAELAVPIFRLVDVAS